VARALAADEARWTATGQLALARLLHTAAPLPSGKVLVAGGYNPSSEVYDPAAGTWARTGDTRVSRRSHTMTALADGRVLIAGGEDCQSGTSAEVYDAASGTWASTGNMGTCRARHAAVALPSGRVLVLGGTDGSGRTLSSAELYDPATGTWTRTSDLRTPRANATATPLASGRVLVTGGDNGGVLLGSAEVYDAATGTWTATGSMGRGRRFHTATALPSGKVLVAGNDGSEPGPSASAELYDPATGTWTATGAMGSPRRAHSATLLADGKVLVAGGYHDYTGISSSAELYDPATGSWGSTASLSVNRYGHTATRLADGRVLAVGGFSTGNQASAELYVSTPPPPPPPVGTPPSGTSVLLQVVDGAGNPLAHAAVSARDSLFPTDSSGRLLLENLSPGRFLARVDALGFTSASVVLELGEGAHLGHQVKLLPQGEPIPFEASTGGVIDTPAVRVSIPANAVVNALGEPVTGTVEVTVAPLDPTTQLGSMPGPLEGTTSASGGQVQLESFFMAEVSLWADGAPAQLAPGASATLEFVLPDALASQFHVGDTVPAWWFDLDAGLWRQEGEGTLQTSPAHPGKLVWVVQVNHFTWWNCDAPITDRSCVDVLVVDDTGAPIPNASIRAEGLSYSGLSSGYTGPGGKACIEIKRGHTAKVSTGTPGQSGYMSAVVTGSAAASLCGRDTCTPVRLVGRSPICTPGAYETCAYPGPAGTLGQGVCRAGRRQCAIDGLDWSACMGEVLPVAESCRSPFDEDCDGAVNEDCTCSDLEGLSCYTGPAGTQGRGQCRGGTVGCGLFGDVACVGQRLPRPEDCSTLGDEDCDGVDTCPVVNQWFWSAMLAEPACATGDAAIDALEVDGSGNTLVLGQLDGTLNLGGTSVTGGGSDLFVAKFNASGVPVWGVVLQSLGMVEGSTLRVDGGGNVLIAGTFSGTLKVGGVSLTSGSGRGPFVVKLSPSGSVLWAQRFESSEWAPVEGLATNPAGDVAISGALKGSLRIGGVEHSASVSGRSAVYVAKLEGGTGTPAWSRSYQHTDYMQDTDVALDEAGNVLFVGSFFAIEGFSPLEFDGTVLTSSPMGPDIFVAKLGSGTGNALWVRKGGSDMTVDLYPQVKVDSSGSVWVLPWVPPGAVLLTKLDAGGEVVANTWLASWGIQQPTVWNATFGPSGNLLLSGWAYGPVDLGGGSQYVDAPAAFVAWYDASGGYVADRLYRAVPGMGAVFGTGGGVDAAGNVVLGGYFRGTAEFGDGPVRTCNQSPFLLKFDPTP
jgi:hypothetical protein